MLDLDKLEAIGTSALVNNRVPCDLSRQPEINRFIAVACDNWQAMIDELRRLRSKIATLEGDCEAWRNSYHAANTEREALLDEIRRLRCALELEVKTNRENWMRISAPVETGKPPKPGGVSLTPSEFKIVLTPVENEKESQLENVAGTNEATIVGGRINNPFCFKVREP